MNRTWIGILAGLFVSISIQTLDYYVKRRVFSQTSLGEISPFQYINYLQIFTSVCLGGIIGYLWNRRVIVKKEIAEIMATFKKKDL